MDRDPLKPTRSGPPDPPLGDQVEPRPFGLGERSPVDPSLTPTAETLRSSERPLRVVPAPQSPVPPREGPPLPSRGASGSGQPSLERLRHELEVTREEIRHLHEMTQELPEIFENKFRQRLRETLQQQRLLLEENASLRQKLLELGPAASHEPRPPLLLPPARTERVEPLEPLARPGLMQSLKEAWGGLAGGRASDSFNGDAPTKDGLADPRHK